MPNVHEAIRETKNAKSAARAAELVVGFRSAEFGSRGLFISPHGQLISQVGDRYAFITAAESVRFYKGLWELLKPELGSLTHADGLEQWLDLVADSIEGKGAAA